MIVPLDLSQSHILFLVREVAVLIYVCRAIDGFNRVFLECLRILLKEADIEVRCIVIDWRSLTGVVYLCCLNDECRDVVIRSQGVRFATLLSEVTCRASLVVRGLKDKAIHLNAQERRREDPKDVRGAPTGARPMLSLAAVVKPGRLAEPILLL